MKIIKTIKFDLCGLQKASYKNETRKYDPLKMKKHTAKKNSEGQ